MGGPIGGSVSRRLGWWPQAMQGAGDAVGRSCLVHFGIWAIQMWIVRAIWVRSAGIAIVRLAPLKATGWPIFLGVCGIAIIPDDLGRDCISRRDAARLLGEKREDDLRRAALRRLAEQEAVEADELRRAQI